MVRRLVLLFILANVVGVIANAPQIISSVDGASIGNTVGRWAIGVGMAAGDLVDEAAAAPLNDADLLELEAELRAGELDGPLDDPSVARLAALWRTLLDVGEQVRADELRELLLDEGVAVEDVAPVPAE